VIRASTTTESMYTMYIYIDYTVLSRPPCECTHVRNECPCEWHECTHVNGMDAHMCEMNAHMCVCVNGMA